MLYTLILSILFTFSAVAGEITGKVVGVTDGDTVKVLIDGKEEKVRLYGIDAPEKKQAYGARSKQHLSSLIFGKQVQIQTHGKDRYHRHIGVIKVAEKNINQEMISSGLAHVYPQYCKLDFCKNWEASQKQAQELKVGLWKESHQIQPWQFRSAKKKASSKERSPKSTCCKVCKKGKACGDSCISRSKSCTKPPGCACNG